jgi:sRNA-binding protein
LFDRRNPLPLAIGIHDAITGALGEVDLRVLGTFLRHWTGRWPYLVALTTEGSMRHALDGSVVEAVSDEHRRFAADRIRELKKRDRLPAGTKPKTPAAPQPKTKARVEPPPPPPCRANSALPTLRLSRSGA